MTKKDGLKPPSMIPEQLYTEADKLIVMLNKKGFHPFERELILYMAWRANCRVSNDYIRVNAIDSEYEEYWAYRRDTEISPGYE